MKGFKITDINFHQAVTLPAGVYTYSCKATPVGSSITFRVGSTDYVIDSLTPGVYQKGIKKTFTIETDQSYFYPSRTVGDEIFEPQLEEGTVATTAGPHILDASEEVSRAGIEINDEMVRTYATKVDVSSEIIQTAESINTRVSNAEGRIGAVEVAADSINTRVSNAEGWIGAVEVTPASINSSVTKSGQIASQILQEDGTVKITAEQIELGGSETADGNFIVNVDGTIKAKGAEIEGKINAISGTFNNVIFQSGHIGGFRVSGTGLTNGPDFNNDAYIIFRNDENKTFAGIGGNVLPSSSGLIAVARFENGATNNFYGSTNYGVIIEASGASRNIGISLVGDIVMKGALVSIEPTFQSAGYTDSIILNISKYRRFLFTPGTSQYLSVDLPSRSEIVDAFGSYKLPSYWNIEIEIEVAWNASGSIALRGSSGGIFVNNNGDVVNHEDTYTYGIIKMKKGDVVTARYNSYHGRWQLINHNY